MDIRICYITKRAKGVTHPKIDCNAAEQEQVQQTMTQAVAQLGGLFSVSSF